MANRTIADVLKIHDEFVKSIEMQLEEGGIPRPVNRDFILRQKEERLDAMRGRLASAEQEKQALIERVDREIAGLHKRIERFEKEIQADRKHLERRPGPVNPEPRRPDRTSVREIRGIGEASEARLRAKGITEAGQVARMNKSELAEILGVSEDRAAEFIREAKRL